MNIAVQESCLEIWNFGLAEDYYVFSEIRPISVDEYLASTKTSVGLAINPDKTISDLKTELLECGLSPEELDWLEP